ncbi:phage tail protein [Vibrio fluvialis]|uniref:phage tail-collar fiber domain-containing protein n=1 Tax=Vibrio fluvialis TaxID=676 RepID=UPI00192C81FE|nr:phage tail protein [Vibrio fluvialis]EKO3451677.1 phage tail protein [Vibrio fluvialis]EKO3461410.1 phage tail protein [Vibrio fluvialis]MBL4266693.1 phage tail protein [Vibrio fluvialis]MBL4270143.1 phage tail protein [Vibrio fluvialis]
MADENTDLRCYLTNAGIAAENNSIQLNRSLNVTEMVFGSGLLADEKDPREQTAMIKEEYAVPCALLFDEDTPTLLVFKGDLPADVGGFYINEVGIRLEDGTIYGYARGKGDYKPTLEQGATDSVRYAVEMYTENADIVVAKIDLSSVYADWEDLEAAKKKAEDDLVVHAAAPNPHPQYPLATKAQGLEFDPDRIYYCGDTCYTRVGDRTYQWEAYRLEPFSGKDPSDPLNRRTGWTDVTKPFYWKPYTPKVPGETMAWDNDAIPENMVVGIGQQLPVAVYHSLAKAKPEWIDATDNTLINIPDRQGRFVRAADGAAWLAGATHEDAIRNIYGSLNHDNDYTGSIYTSGSFSGAFYPQGFSGTNKYIRDGVSVGSGWVDAGFDASRIVPTAPENQPKAYIEWVGYAL